MADYKQVILYDGDCALCNKSVYRIYKLDREKRIFFASLQSEFGQSLLKKHQLPADYIDSIVFVDEEKSWLKSTAGLKLLPYLSRWLLPCYLFYILPAFIRDYFYDLIARNRHRIVKQDDSCRIGDHQFKKQIIS